MVDRKAQERVAAELARKALTEADACVSAEAGWSVSETAVWGGARTVCATTCLTRQAADRTREPAAPPRSTSERRA